MLSETAIPLDTLRQRRESPESLTNCPVLKSERSDSAVENLSDELLLERAGEGSKDALALLFRRHARIVRQVGLRILGNEAEADDLVQEVFLFLYRKAQLFDRTRGGALSWLVHVAYHRAFDRRRFLSSRHFYSSQELDHAAERLADPRQELRFHERTIEGVFGKDVMARFEASLSPDQQETLRLFFFEGYTLREIAALTGRTWVNVRSQYYRGLERLRTLIQPGRLRSR
jgi:RNA polymerase sigma-70 factor, ECF subfamily